MLEAREGNPASDLVDIAQVFQRSGTLSVSWKDSNITTPADFKGKKVGAWGFGNEFEVTAAATRPVSKPGTDYTKVIQPFDMTLLLSKQIDVAEAMIYNEYAQVLEAKNPETGELIQADRPQRHQLQRRRDRDAPGRAVRPGVLASQAGNEDIATRFLKASFQGWIYCRDQPSRLRPVHGQGGLDPRRRAPGVDDERDQPAGLAVAERHRDHGSRRVAAVRRCRARCRHHQGRPAGRGVPHRPRDRGPGRDHRRHQGRRLQEGRSHRSRRAATRPLVGSRRHEGPAREGRPFDFGVGQWRVLCWSCLPPRTTPRRRGPRRSGAFCARVFPRVLPTGHGD